MSCIKCKHNQSLICINENSNMLNEKVDWRNCCNYFEQIEELQEKRLKKETVNHPSHYNQGIEAIEIIESWDLNFSLGNAIKYILRAPHKSNTLEDLKKAEWYIKREIERIEKLANIG